MHYKAPPKLLILALLLLPVPLFAADWSQWLGPDRNAVSNERGLNLDWKKKKPKLLWKVPLGSGFSGMSLVGNRLYTMMSENKREFATAHDATTGKELWRRDVGPLFEDGQGGDGPRTTPTLVGNSAYVMGGHGMVMALDSANGAVRWQKSLVNDFGGKVPTWGYSTSPLVQDGTVFLEAGGALGHALIALNATDGSLRWNVGEYKAGYSSPTPITINGQKQVVYFTAREFVSVDPATGKVLWFYPWKTSYDVSAATPVFVPPDKLLISSGYGTGAAMFRIKPGSGPYVLKELWRSKYMQNKMATSVIHKNHIYGFDDFDLACIDANTGKRTWKQESFGRGTLLLVEGHLVVLGENCKLALLEANPKRVVIKEEIQLDGDRCWTIPSLSNGVLYVRDLKQMMAFDLRAK
jgi:outer membrane protein assembly factor BamB